MKKTNIPGDVKEFTISRAKWARGDSSASEPNYLLRTDGSQCCLGHYATACGIPDQALLEEGYPSAVAFDEDGHMVWKTQLVGDEVGTDKPITINLTHVNDDGSLTEEEREDRVIRLFSRFGITVKFTK